MNSAKITVSVGQVYDIHPDADMSAGQYAVKAFGARPFGNGGDYVSLRINCVGSKKTWSIAAKDFFKWVSNGVAVLVNTEDRTQIQKKGPERIPLVPGARGMLHRHYNSKRIVEEPCEVIRYDSKGLFVKWLMDGKESGVFWNLKDTTIPVVNPKWIVRKITELTAERDAMNLKISNLMCL